MFLTTAFSITDITSTITSIFSGLIDMISTVVNTITGNPLLLFGTLFGFCGVAIGLFKRLFK